MLFNIEFINKNLKQKLPEMLMNKGLQNIFKNIFRILLVKKNGCIR